MKRKIALVFVGNGWGAPDMRTERGAAKAAQVLPKLLKEEHPEVFYMDFHSLGSIKVVQKIPKREQEQRYLQITQAVKSLSILVTDILKRGLFPIVIGGDHSIAIGTWSGVKLANLDRNFGLLWFDAHMDAHTIETSESHSAHGMPLSALLGYGYFEWANLGGITPKLYPQNLTQIGVRSFESGEEHFLAEQNVKVFFEEDVDVRGLAKVYEEAHNHVTRDTSYFGISIDIDVFDPSVAPGTGTTEKNGLELEALLPLIRGLRSDPNCLCLEIAEFNPDKDQNDKTLNLLTKLVTTVTERPEKRTPTFYMEREKRFGAHNYHPLPVVLTKGQGAWVWDVDGNKYLDMMSAYSAVSHGHCHPRIRQALVEQAERLTICSRAYYNDKLGGFLETLCKLVGMDMALPMNSGAEAVETAIKAVRRWGYQYKKIPDNQAEIIVTSSNFHGRTVGIISFSSDESYRAGYGPFLPGFKIVPFGDAKSLADAITPNTCAVITEPIQGEAGIVIPPQGWLQEIKEICQQNNVLLVLDEIQSGLGRTGKILACEHEGVKPDAVILGKALGGGYIPVSALVGKRELIEVFTPGSHGSTFGGNPLAASVGLTALKVMQDEHLVERSAELGEYFSNSLKKISSPIVKEIRGRGLWIGVDIDPKKKSARSLCEELMHKGILSKETHETVVRFAPPLVIERKDLDWAIERIRSVLTGDLNQWS